MRRGKIAYWLRVPDDVSPAKAAPPGRPDPDFIRHGRIARQRVPKPEPEPSQGQSA
jgi:hypothetical protein